LAAGPQVPPDRILTAFDTTPWNTFLGYYLDPVALPEVRAKAKRQQGVIWGKDPKHFNGRAPLLRRLADVAHLRSTLPPDAPSAVAHANIQVRPPPSKKSSLQDQWRDGCVMVVPGSTRAT
jgi:hypothetical protein